MAKFPGPEWVDQLIVKLNQDERYADIAKNWEGDLLFLIEADQSFPETTSIYIDLWHGKCRGARMVPAGEAVSAAFTLKAPYENFRRVLTGELEPMQAMVTRKLGVQGNFVMLMRNVPTVLDFVRCCREVTDVLA